MKILIFGHRFEMGGTQVNAIELSTMLRDNFGHEIIIFAIPGAMVKIALEKGLKFIPAPNTNKAVCFKTMQALYKTIENERPDLIHTWEPVQCINAFYAAHLRHGIPMVVTDMGSDIIQKNLPKSLITTFGTPDFVDKARALGWKNAKLLLPPIDIDLNAPSIVNPRLLRKKYNIQDSELVLVTVSRIAAYMKLESLRNTIRAVRDLGNEYPIRFILVGSGDAWNEIEKLTTETNAYLGRQAIILTGEMLDPRPAYASADIVIGMGSSALRGMSFEKPVIVVGVNGFSKPVTPESQQYFLYNGIYGVGEKSENGHNLLISHIRALINDRDNFTKLGKFSRQLVVDNFSLQSISGHLNKYCQTATSDKRSLPIAIYEGLTIAAALADEFIKNFEFRQIIPYSLRQKIKRAFLNR